MNSSLATPAMLNSMKEFGVIVIDNKPQNIVPKRRTRNKQEEGRLGRPSYAERATDEELADAPFEEMVTANAADLAYFIRYQISSHSLLRDAYRFEVGHHNRKSVLDAIEGKLRRLNLPLGGPDKNPLDHYQLLGEEEIIERASSLSGRERAELYAWEYHGNRRKPILNACSKDNKLAEKVARETAPPKREQPAEPFPGYDRLKCSADYRVEIRQTLQSCSQAQLSAAIEYENKTKKRAVMLDALRIALIAKSREQ